MVRQPYQKELKELEDARYWFYRRAQLLFDEAYGEDLSEEQQMRFSQLVAQFDVTARRLLQETEKDIEWYQPVLDAPAGAPTPANRERVRLQVEAALKLRILILDTRSTISRA